MISFFRRIVGSKFGAVFALVFLGMIAFAFVAGDLDNQASGGNFSFFGSGGAAKVGSATLTESELQSRVQRVFEQARRDNPGLPVDAFLAQDAVTQISNQLVAGLAVTEFAKRQGVHISKRMIDAQIAAIPAFHDASGKFSQTAFRELLRSQGLSEKALRDDIAKDIYTRIMTAPAALSPVLPESLVLPYASLLLEARQGKIAAIPAAAFAPAGDPTDAQLKAFYTANSSRYTVPEQRKLRYAVIDASRFAGAATPSDAEIAAYYAQNKAQYAASESRTIEQLTLPSQAAAQAAMGKPLAAAASAAGLEVAALPSLSQADLARQTSDAIAKAAFAAPQGGSAGPLRSALGWAVIRVAAIEKRPQTPLAAVRAEIVTALSTQKQAQLLSDFTAKLEDEAANGATFDEIVKDNGLQTEVTPAVISTGQSIDNQAYAPGPDVAPLLKSAFDMEADDEPQLAPITAQKRYALLDVTDITASAPAPLAKIRDIVVQQYKLREGAKRARAIADAMTAKIARGMPIEQAFGGAGVPLPPVQNIGGRRADLLRGEKQPQPEIALLFAMPKGSVKVLPMGQDRGFFVLQLGSIQQGDAAQVAGLTDRVRGGLLSVAANEYAAQLGRAIERDLGVTRDAAAIARVSREVRRLNGTAAQ